MDGTPPTGSGRYEVSWIVFWRVTGLEPDRLLRLRAEMKVPGEAWLEFTVEPTGGDSNSSILVQTALFKPRGLFGIIYWYTLFPLHKVVFGSMMKGIRLAALKTTKEHREDPMINEG